MTQLAPAALVAALLLSALPAAAQRSVSAGQTVSGRLASGDPTLDDGSHYHVYTYRARAGEQIEVTLRSEDFDAYLAVGRGMQNGECEEECDTDDDGAGGTDARVLVRRSEAGTYSIRVNSLSEGETGAYTLQVESREAPKPRDAERGEIRVGRAVNGSLADDDATADDGSYMEYWTFRPDFSGRVTVTMRSEDFDAYLAVGQIEADEFEESESDDDGAGGTDAQVELTVQAGRTYTIRANSLSQGETGDYTLEVTRS